MADKYFQRFPRIHLSRVLLNKQKILSPRVTFSKNYCSYMQEKNSLIFLTAKSFLCNNPYTERSERIVFCRGQCLMRFHTASRDYRRLSRIWFLSQSGHSSVNTSGVWRLHLEDAMFCCGKSIFEKLLDSFVCCTRAGTACNTDTVVCTAN